MIRAELEQALADPWSSLWLWRDGLRQADICGLCPGTAALVSGLPMADQAGHAPTALLEVLEPGARTSSGAGQTNARTRVHLPLILPGPARLRVGNDMRDWRAGEAWAFDETIPHESWNEADRPAVILAFDVWNPRLSVAERDFVTAMMTNGPTRSGT